MNLRWARQIVAASMMLLVSGYCIEALAAPASEPHQLVEKVTEALLSDIDRYRLELESSVNEAQKQQMIGAFFSEVTKTLEPVVDFNWIALNVMGNYRKTATEEQRYRFREAFTQGLVETYGRGLLTYSNQKIVVFPPQDDTNGKRKVTVVQEIQGEDRAYPLLYSMGLNRSGEWKVLNVIINGINLGSTFRNQFMQSVEKYDGDLDKVIDNWANNQS